MSTKIYLKTTEMLNWTFLADLISFKNRTFGLPNWEHYRKQGNPESPTPIPSRLTLLSLSAF